jgi:hypothetical protein
MLFNLPHYLTTNNNIFNMKKLLIPALCIGIVIAACKKEESTVGTASQPSYVHQHMAARFTGDSTDTFGASPFITIETANEMISSYLSSINFTANDSDVFSYTINADSLRAYLADASIKNIKIIMAHSMAYINAGHVGQNAGYQTGALTLILAGYNSSGNYVYYNGMVMDHAAPCPYTCPAGNAGGVYLE